ncbi:MAG: hypothetical protein DMF07_09785 [Verrucomicrobia bacterium]|nr:MAG: hypothetical protein DMF07_09785 [Verrucomicrobiota bacterium]
MQIGLVLFIGKTTAETLVGLRINPLWDPLRKESALPETGCGGTALASNRGGAGIVGVRVRGLREAHAIS